MSESLELSCLIFTVQDDSEIWIGDALCVNRRIIAANIADDVLAFLNWAHAKARLNRITQPRDDGQTRNGGIEHVQHNET